MHELVQAALCSLVKESFEFWTAITALAWPVGRLILHAVTKPKGTSIDAGVLGGDVFKGLAIFPFLLLTATVLFPRVGAVFVEHHAPIVGIAGAFACTAALGTDAQALVDRTSDGLRELVSWIGRRWKS